MSNANLIRAAREKNDEFYTQRKDIERELEREEYRAFAHMFCITIQNPQAIEHICEYFPKSYGIFLEMINKGGRLK